MDKILGLFFLDLILVAMVIIQSYSILVLAVRLSEIEKELIEKGLVKPESKESTIKKIIRWFRYGN